MSVVKKHIGATRSLRGKKLCHLDQRETRGLTSDRCHRSKSSREVCCCIAFTTQTDSPPQSAVSVQPSFSIPQLSSIPFVGYCVGMLFLHCPVYAFGELFLSWACGRFQPHLCLCLPFLCGPLLIGLFHRN